MRFKRSRMDDNINRRTLLNVANGATAASEPASETASAQEGTVEDPTGIEGIFESVDFQNRTITALGVEVQ